MLHVAGPLAKQMRKLFRKLKRRVIHYIESRSREPKVVPSELKLHLVILDSSHQDRKSASAHDRIRIEAAENHWRNVSMAGCFHNQHQKS